ncbi:MAG: hypothetical protein D3M94_15915 [Rhodocyclales bacterium GT-UBC]|nr:MAG: hypothetical protein D3M94_15915 [Rhodocyclales bacterium GT-UBC]
MADDYAGSALTTGRLAVGGSVTGNIESAYDNDWFAISLLAGQRYTFNLDPGTSGGLSDTYLRLYNASSLLLAYDDDSGPGLAAQLTYTASATGTYYLGASGYSWSTGSYRLSATSSAAQQDDFAASTATTGSLAPGATVTGRVEVAGDNDWFRINLEAGRHYVFNLNPGASSALSDPYLSLYNASGSLLAANDDAIGLASQIAFDCTTTGSYYLGARGYGSLVGSYTLSASSGVVLDDYGQTAGTAGSIAVGAALAGSIETANDEDWFAINLTAGQRYTFNLDSAASGGLGDPLLGLVTASGTVLAVNDDANGLASQITYTPTASGTYYLLATAAYSNMTGNYILRTSVAAAAQDDYAASSATTGSLAIGGSATGQIERAGDADWFAVNLTAGQRYVFNLDPASSGGLSDPYLNLYSSSGSLLAYNDDTNGLASQITYTAASSGTYYLGARAYSGETGAYVLRATSSGGTSDDYAANTATTGRISVGGSATGRVEVSGDSDWFAVSLNAGQTYRFNLNGTASSGLSDPTLTLFNGTGSVLAQNDDANGTRASQIDFTASSSGTYYLAANGHGTSTGNYQLTATAVSQSAASGFSIDVAFSGGSQYQSYFTAAAQRWATVITGDLPDVGSIDDLRISASVSSIDGVGGILGQAGAQGVRSNGGLPYSGVMQFDQADVDSMIAQGTFASVVLHEMGHVLGFSGYFFNLHGLLNPSNPYQYIGTHALQAYRSLNPQAGNYVPIEQLGGSGTAGSHWSEAVFNTELMTGYAENSPPMPLSIVTIGALQDLGYTVNYAAADAFML